MSISMNYGVDKNFSYSPSPCPLLKYTTTPIYPVLSGFRALPGLAGPGRAGHAGRLDCPARLDLIPDPAALHHGAATAMSRCPGLRRDDGEASETNFALQLKGWRENMENFCGSKPPEGGCGSRQAQGFYPLWQPTASVFHGNRRFADCDPIAQFDRFDPRTTIGLPLEKEPLQFNINLRGAPEEVVQLTHNIKDVAEQFLYHWKTFPILLPPPLACASGSCKSCNDNSGGGAGGNIGNGIPNHMMNSITNSLDISLDATEGSSWTQSLGRRHKQLNLRDLFVAPSFDELDAVAVDNKGEPHRLNSKQLESIRERG
ncbi:E3 ubiquitin-protein ligase TRIP12 [Frankliniella fusca]|uniref:E3 ubiquitin-protein ligase TRIP12 n=1 Tax=Frankliniella fusca TaxID=407009 RepID=A0AAE1LEI0_9NEOP|nr:E3 ubiquitin-protein ligase TRIP12 [Frankliniella fusca]